MKKYLSHVCILAISILSATACTTTPITTNVVASSDSRDTLFVYEDGRMEFNSRFVNDEDVVIYQNGRGGEQAAIKVRVPIHPDFYRDSITVVRVVNKFDESIGQRETVNPNNIN
jgi:hypothetical protein